MRHLVADIRLRGCQCLGNAGNDGSGCAVELVVSHYVWNGMRLRIFLGCSAMALSSAVMAQSGGGYLITTVAGNGIQGFGGDGGLATATQLNGPYGVAVDAAGNLFVADGANFRIRKVSANGIITTVAGNGTSGFSGDGGLATAAQLNGPYGGVAADAAGNLFIADNRQP